MKRFLLLASPLICTASIACCGVGRGPVRFTGQSDIVIWDAAHKVEHFVREARFDSKGDLGFLAPVPSVPTFAEVSPKAFEVLETLANPPAVTTGSAGAAMKSMPSAVVLKRENVAGYDAVVLRAGDSADLRNWLTQNGFPAPAWMEAWAAPYLAKGWPIAAFRVLKGETPRPVRMTFSTNIPFAPYAVPEENGGNGVPLRLYLVSLEDLGGRVGARTWGAHTIGKATLPNDRRSDLAHWLKLKPEDIPAGATVRAFEDSEFGKEPDHDLTFEPTSDAGVGNALVSGGAIVLFSLGLGRLFGKRRA